MISTGDIIIIAILTTLFIIIALITGLGFLGLFKIFIISRNERLSEIYFPKHRFVIAFVAFWLVYIAFDVTFKITSLSTYYFIMMLIIAPFLFWSKKLYLTDNELTIENYLFLRPKRFNLAEIDEIDYDWKQMESYVSKTIDVSPEYQHEVIPELLRIAMRKPLEIILDFFGIDYRKHNKEAEGASQAEIKYRDIIKNNKNWMNLIPRNDAITIFRQAQFFIMPVLIIKLKDGKQIKMTFSFESEYFDFIELLRRKIKESKSKLDNRVTG